MPVPAEPETPADCAPADGTPAARREPAGERHTAAATGPRDDDGRSADERDVGWGDPPEDAARARWFQAERPPHWQ